MSKRYLSNSSLTSLCKKGDKEEIEEYLTWYEELRENLSDDLDMLNEVIVLVYTEESRKLAKYLDNDKINNSTLYKIGSQLKIEKDCVEQLIIRRDTESRLSWYDKVIEDLEDAL